MLVATAFNSIVQGIVSHFDDLYFPRIDSHTMRAMKLAAHVQGGAVATEYSVALHNMAMRGVIINSELIFQFILEVFAVVLTVALTSHLYRYGSDTITSAIGRLQTVQGLIRTLLRLAVRILIAGVVGCTALIVVCIILLLLFFKGHVPNAASHFEPSLGLSLVLMIAVFPSIGIVASYVMPYFLDTLYQILRQAPESYSAHHRLTTQARRYAWIMAGGIVCLGLLVGNANIALTGTPVLTNIYLHSIDKMIASSVDEIPIIAFVVATTLMVMDAAEPVSDRELA
jgi:hypothetical protein